MKSPNLSFDRISTPSFKHSASAIIASLSPAISKSYRNVKNVKVL